MNSSEANLKLPVGNARLVKKSDRDMFEDTPVVGDNVGDNETISKVSAVISNPHLVSALIMFNKPKLCFSDQLENYLNSKIIFSFRSGWVW